MKLKRRTALGLSAGALALAPAIVRAQAATKLDLSTVWPNGSLHTINAKAFAEQVGKLTGGAVDISVKAGGQLGFREAELLRAVRDGLVPMADILDVQQAGDEPMLGIEGIPFLVGSIEELEVLHRHVRPVFDTIALANNQTILYATPRPAQYLHLKVKADSVDALKAIRIRVPDKTAQDMSSAIGMAPALIPWSETMAALRSGAVSGVSTSAVSAVDGKLWEVLKFFHATHHQWSSQIVTINNDAWKKLGAANQKVIAELATKMEPAFWESSRQADKDGARRLADGGMQRVTVSEAMLAELRKRTAGMLTDFWKRVPASERPIKGYLAEVGRA